MLDPKQVAERLNVSQSLVYKLIHEGKLACYRINSALRISEEQLRQYLEHAKEETTKRLPKAGKRYF